MSHSLRFGRAGRVLTLATLALLASACGAGGNEARGSSEREDIGAEPVTEDAASFSARFAVVSGIVGEDAARRLMPDRARQATPFYTQELASGEYVDWYEPFEGFAVVALRGTVENDFDAEPFTRNTSASELFRKLEPNQAVPVQLRELDRRRVEMLPAYRALSAAKDSFREFHVPGFSDTERETEAGLDASVRLGEDVGQQRFAITADQCISKAPTCVAGGQDWSIVQKDRTVDSKIPRGDTGYVNGTGCCQTGQILYRVSYKPWWDWYMWFSVPLNAGQYIAQWTLYLESGVDFDFEGRLLEVRTGDMGSQSACGTNGGF